LAESRGEAKRLIKQKAVSLDNVVITDPAAQIKPVNGQVLKVGKRRFLRLVVK
jgi:tyrosyl-tRNA synthetase